MSQTEWCNLHAESYGLRVQKRRIVIERPAGSGNNASAAAGPAAEEEKEKPDEKEEPEK